VFDTASVKSSTRPVALPGVIPGLAVWPRWHPGEDISWMPSYADTT